MNFRELGPRITVSSPCPDGWGNLWRIDVTGDPEVVWPFVDSRGLIVEAIPLSEEQHAQWVREEREAWWDKLRRQLTGPTLAVAPDPAQQEQSFPSPLGPEGERLPAMSIAIVLVELAQAGPHRLRFEVDPDIHTWSSPQTISFQLRKGDFTPDVTISMTQGSAWLYLHGGGSDWVAEIIWGAGAPAHYTLQGDLVRN